MNKKKRKVYFTIIIGLLGGLYFFSTMSVFSSNIFFAAQLEEETVASDPFEPIREKEAEGKVAIYFDESTKAGTVGDMLLVAFHTGRPISEIAIRLPQSAVFVEEELPKGVKITSTTEENGWKLTTDIPRSDFLVPLVVDTAGAFPFEVAESMIILEIKEARETNPTDTQEDALTDSSDSTDQFDQEDNEDQLPKEKEIESQIPDESESDPGNLYLLGDDVKKRGVANWVEFMAAMVDPTVNYIYLTASFQTNDNPRLGITGIDGWSSSANPNGGLAYVYINASRVSRTLIIDGLDTFQMDLRAVAICFRDSSVNPDSPWDITLQNLELYHGNFWGAIEYHDLNMSNQQRSIIRYHNLNHTGNQLFYGLHSRASFSGHSVSHQTPRYTSDFNASWMIHSNTQANFEINQIELREGANVEMSTISSGNLDFYNTNARLILGNNARLSLNANGSAGEAGGANIRFVAGNGRIELGKGAELALNTQNNSPAVITSGTPHDIRLMEKSRLSVTATNRTLYSHIFWLSANTHVTLEDSSTLEVEATNQNTTANIFHFSGTTGNLNVGKDATLDILTDSPQPVQRLLFFSGANNPARLTIDDAKRVNLQRTRPITTTTNGLIEGGGITAKNQAIRQWWHGNTGDPSDFQWQPILSMTAAISGTNTNVTNVSSLNEETSRGFASQFASRSQRLLFERIPDITVTIDPLTEDRTLPNAYTISGTANPGSYLRFQREGLMPEPTLETPVDSAGNSEYFHTQAGENGHYLLDLSDLEPFQYFTQGEVVTAQAFLDGKWAEASTTVEPIGDVDPKDPLDPDQPILPENPPLIPENRGFISIDFVSQFDFGKVPIRSSTSRYPARPQRISSVDDHESTERPNYIQVSDRRFLPNGWTLSARLSEEGFVSTDAFKHYLKGASVHLNNIEMVTSKENRSEAPDYFEAIELGPQNQVIARANENQGTGTWIQRYGNEHTMQKSVELEIPIGARPQATSYQGTLRWELSFVPGADE
ncbi:WxL domain-containing protein [Enterococcus entomosocium]|uniref:WxL domain-containing protein n=1 Tax=Enterococcus entomosocium TaxID=3034352 RepID=A0ABV3MC50_9ENTE|nr:WxL domain-containing protein [Enterococcus casseliflavus]MDB1708149.1 WxL domain-containing protein [Enterococcus casseliflavus]MDB1716689.1 WxL domain-containing protein [Enterococcus casseliflavus]